MINCILWDNSIPAIDGFVSATYSDIQEGLAGVGNLNLNPLFDGSGNYPFALTDDSPCVNSGTPDTTGLNLPEYDLAGNLRIYGERIDMGAYENQNVIVNADDFLIPSNITLFH